MMTRRVATTLALVALFLACALGLAAAARGQGEPVYTVAAVRAGLAHQPRLWIGRTILVRGRLALGACPGGCPGQIAVLTDPADTGQRLGVSGVSVDPVLGFLRAVPVASALFKPHSGGVGVYRVLLVRQTFASTPGSVPLYFPYTKRVVTVTRDSAVLMDGLP